MYEVHSKYYGCVRGVVTSKCTLKPLAPDDQLTTTNDKQPYPSIHANQDQPRSRRILCTVLYGLQVLLDLR